MSQRFISAYLDTFYSHSAILVGCTAHSPLLQMLRGSAELLLGRCWLGPERHLAAHLLGLRGYTLLLNSLLGSRQRFES